VVLLVSCGDSGGYAKESMVSEDGEDRWVTLDDDTVVLQADHAVKGKPVEGIPGLEGVAKWGRGDGGFDEVVVIGM
jgi:hypothetical protein